MRQTDLYSIPLTQNDFTTRCGGGNDPTGNDEACVLFAALPDGGIALKDSKNPSAGELRFTGEEWARFLGKTD